MSTPAKGNNKANNKKTTENWADAREDDPQQTKKDDDNNEEDNEEEEEEDDAPAKTKMTAEEEQLSVQKELEEAQKKQGSGLLASDKAAKVEITDFSDEKEEKLLNKIYKAADSFADLNLKPELQKAVDLIGFVHPSKIQAQAIPMILSESRPNLIGQAHHGSGKTAAFSLSMLSMVDESVQTTQAICLCHTRELAIQTAAVITKLAQFTKIKVFIAISGSARGKLTDHIVVGTPGSVNNKLKFRDVDARGVRMLVVDEADHFFKAAKDSLPVKQIRGRLPRETQVLLFSATFPPTVRKFCTDFAPQAKKITVKTEDLTLDNIRQYQLKCSETEKYEMLTTLYELANVGQVIIFVNTKATGDGLKKQLEKDKYSAQLTHSGLEDADRDKVMEEFRKGTTNVLIATDMLSRGVDVPAVKLVINYDVPVKQKRNSSGGYEIEAEPEVYLHRVCRAGRYGTPGAGVTLVEPKEQKYLDQIETTYAHKDAQQKGATQVKGGLIFDIDKNNMEETITNLKKYLASKPKKASPNPDTKP